MNSWDSKNSPGEKARDTPLMLHLPCHVNNGSPWPLAQPCSGESIYVFVARLALHRDLAAS